MGEHRNRPARSKGGGLRLWGVAFAVAAVVLVIVVAWQAQTPAPVNSSQPAVSAKLPPGMLVPAVARRETRPTLDPALFVGKAALAHQVAREIPDVLDQLYCYCYCDKHMGHKSLLSCFTDGHAAT